MFVLAIIPARGGSKGIKNKNLKKVKGKTLIEYTISEAKSSKLVNDIYVSTDSIKIINIAKKNKVNFIKRPRELSKDHSKTIDAVKHLTKFYKKKFNFFPDYIIILQPTSPLRKSYHIDKALNKIFRNKSSDSLVSCVKIKHNFNPESLMQINKNGNLLFKKTLLRRQDKKQYYVRNGAAIYIIRYPVYLKEIFGKNTIPYVMDVNSSLDIDDFEDLKYFRKLISEN